MSEPVIVVPLILALKIFATQSVPAYSACFDAKGVDGIKELLDQCV